MTSQLVQKNIFNLKIENFTRNLLNWSQIEFERNLPWKFETDPYRIWVSEIMLQQTRADTVIPYYDKFIQIFPDVETLANASEDQVLSLWSGLGYYARARNLHKSAKVIQVIHGSKFPSSFADIIDLPGIGKSTAGAICALAFGLKTPILDGNAKRVYSRFHCVDDESESIRNKKLWNLAEQHTPLNEAKIYTQKIMDLGATVCLPRNPLCNLCPVAAACCGMQSERLAELPISKKPIVRRSKKITMVIAVDQNKNVLLERRPAKGIWGGIWSFPEFSGPSDKICNWSKCNYFIEISQIQNMNSFRHELTHLSLLISPIIVKVEQIHNEFTEHSNLQFVNPSEDIELAVPAPVNLLLKQILKVEF